MRSAACRTASARSAAAAAGRGRRRRRRRGPASAGAVSWKTTAPMSERNQSSERASFRSALRASRKARGGGAGVERLQQPLVGGAEPHQRDQLLALDGAGRDGVEHRLEGVGEVLHRQVGARPLQQRRQRQHLHGLELGGELVAQVEAPAAAAGPPRW